MNCLSFRPGPTPPRSNAPSPLPPPERIIADDASTETGPDETGPIADERCPNCGARLRGEWCHDCGQHTTDRIVPLRRLAGEALEDLLQLDLRIVRTLRTSLRPGALTEDYLAGRRIRHVPPLRLLLVGGFLLLLAVGVGRSLRPSAGGMIIQLDEDTVTRLVEERDRLLEAGSLRARIRASAIGSMLEGHRNPELLNRIFVERLSIAAVLLLPLFALLLRLLYRGRLYVEHLVFSAHLHALVFGAIGLVMLIGLAGVELGLPDAALRTGVLTAFAGVVAYTGLAMRRVYGEGVGVTLLKLGVLFTGYAVAFVVVFSLYAMQVLLSV